MDYKESRSKKEMVTRRNNLLLEYLSKINHQVKLIGNPETPAIIVDNSYCLSAYVHNFDLNFVDEPKSGNIKATFKLRSNRFLSSEDFKNLIAGIKQRSIYKIQYKDTNLFLAGYNFMNKELLSGKYPVFSAFRYKIYFNKSHAVNILEEFNDYPLIII